jgi:branched-chain amino acid transport system permease protein
MISDSARSAFASLPNVASLPAIADGRLTTTLRHFGNFARFVGGIVAAAAVLIVVAQLWRRVGSKALVPVRTRIDSLPTAGRRGLAVAAVALAYFLPMWSGFNKTAIPTTKVDFLSMLNSSAVPFVLIALGLNVVVGMAGLLDLGYVGFYAVGAYVVGILTSKHASWPWLASVPVAVIATMLIGVLLGAPTLRLRGDYLAIVTLGFGEIIRLSADNFSWLGSAEGISAIRQPPTLGLTPYSTELNRWYWAIGLTLVIAVLFFLTRLENSRVGRAWNAIREDEDAAEMMGVPTFTFKLWAFAIGAAIGGLAGVWYAGQLTTIYPTSFDINKSVLFLSAVVLGGLGNKWGAVLGGFAVAYLPERFRFIDDKRFVVFGLVLIVMMIFRPEGLLPRKLGGGRRGDRDSGRRGLEALSKSVPAALVDAAAGATGNSTRGGGK